MGNGSSKRRTIPGEGSRSGSRVSSTRSSNAPKSQSRSIDTNTKGLTVSAVKKTFAEQYTLAKDLGSGAFSVVKLAVDKVPFHRKIDIFSPYYD